jgi:uncharacterized protein (TIGR01777 family)
MKICITGGTGFIGTALCNRFLREGNSVSVLTRDRRRAARKLGRKLGAVESLEELTAESAPEVIVNLAGRSLGRGRWTPTLKQQFITSRVETTARIVRYLSQAEVKPRILISGSAVGYYGARRNEVLDEFSSPGNEFQADLCKAWEEEALKAEDHGTRVCLLRTGIVLGSEGGALTSMLPSFKLGLGGSLGDGRQWMSWIHMDDLIGIILHLMLHETLAGPFNATAPNPVTNREFAETLGKAMGRPTFMRLPAWLVRAAIGEMAHMLVTGQKVIPVRLLESGYEFKFPDVGTALEDILGG